MSLNAIESVLKKKNRQAIKYVYTQKKKKKKSTLKYTRRIQQVQNGQATKENTKNNSLPQ